MEEKEVEEETKEDYLDWLISLSAWLAHGDILSWGMSILTVQTGSCDSVEGRLDPQT